MLTIFEHKDEVALVIHKDRLITQPYLNYYSFEGLEQDLYIQDKCSKFDEEFLEEICLDRKRIKWWPDKEKYVTNYITYLEGHHPAEAISFVKDQIITLLLLELSQLK